MILDKEEYLRSLNQRHPFRKDGRSFRGRPVWELPVLDYSNLIDQDVHEKQRKLLMEYYNDIDKVTKYMDLQAEENVLTRYLLWAIDHSLQSNKIRGNEGSNKKTFFRKLTINLCADMLDIRIEFTRI